MDSGRSASLIGRNQIALGVNTTARGGFITHRPGYRKVPLRFLDEDGDTDASLRSAFENGRFQGGSYYKPVRGGKESIVLSISGRQFVIYPDQLMGPANDVRDITPATGRNNATKRQVWMEQAEDFLVIQDGQSKAIIWNGSSARRATAGEVPVGTVMAYGLGRLWVARGREFVAGDIVRGPSGTTAYDRRDSVLKFTENDYFNEGGSFMAPEEISGMRFPSNLDTSLGEGELTVFFKHGAVTVRVPTSRDEWKNLQIPLQRVSLKPFGATAQNSIVEVNGDFWFRSPDGMRSFVMAQRQFGEWGNVPMSREMERIIKRDDERLLGFSSAVLFDNRLLMTCAPQRSFDSGTYFLGLVALDFDLVTSMFERTPPAYDGVWTGVKVLQILKGEFHGIERCFMVVLNECGAITLWEVTREDIYDRPSDTSETRIAWNFDTRSFSFPDLGDDLKRLSSGRLWIDKLLGQADFCVKYRPDQYPLWQDWGPCWTKRATKDWCPDADSCLPEIPLAQFRTEMRLPMPTNACEETSGKKLDQGYEFEARVEVTGSCRLRRMRVKADVVSEDLDAGCPQNDDEDLTLNGCETAIFDYQSGDEYCACTLEIVTQPTVSYGEIEWDTEEDVATWDTEGGSTITISD